MRAFVSAAVVVAAAGLASADFVTQDAQDVTVINSLDTSISGSFQSLAGQAGNRSIVGGSSYNASGGWGDASGYAPVVSVASAAVPHNGTFDGLSEAYAGGAATQLGDTWGVAEFSGTATNGNEYVQISFFSLTGTTMDAYAATGNAYDRIGMAAGVGFFTSEGQDSLDVAEPGFTFLSASFGFFDLSGSYLGAADVSSNNFSDASGLGAIGILNANNAGLAGNIGEMFIYIEYEAVPSPASVSLIALGGLVATRRRR